MTQECGRLTRLVAVVMGIALCVSACISPRGQEARDLLADIAAGGGPSRLKEATPEPAEPPLQGLCNHLEHSLLSPKSVNDGTLRPIALAI